MSAVRPPPPEPARDFGELAMQVAELRARFEERTAALQRQLDRAATAVEVRAYMLVLGSLLAAILAKVWH
jgi:hypothetical protein